MYITVMGHLNETVSPTTAISSSSSSSAWIPLILNG